MRTATIQSFGGLRFVFVMLVFMSHYSWGDTPMFDFGGDCGVAFFFMLSGFGLMNGYGDRAVDGSLDTRRFVLRRLRRIYPMHLVAMVFAAVAIPWSFVDAKADVAAILLLQSWSADAYFATNGPSWFLSTLIVLYLLFPLMARCVGRMSLRGAVMLAVALLVLMTAVYAATACAHIDKDAATRWLYVFPPARIVDFLLGMVVFRLCRAAAPRVVDLSTRTANALQTVSMVLTAALVPIYYAVGIPWELGAIFWLPMAAVIAVFVLTDGKGLTARLMSSRILRCLGGISMEIFLLHVPVITALHRLDAHLPFDIGYLGGLAVSLALTLPLAAAVHALLRRLKLA